MEYRVNYNKKPGKAKSLFLGFFIGLLFLGAATESFIGYKMVNDPATLGISTEQPSNNPTSLTLPAKPGVQTFVSQKYGYGFYYQPYATASDGSRLNLSVSELDGGMVVVYDDQSRQPVRLLEVFQKDPTDTLADSVRKQLLNGTAPSNCSVNTSPVINDKNFPSDFIAAALSATPNQTAATAGASLKRPCPQSYVTTDNSKLKLFIMDPKHSNTFLFVDLGSPTIQAGQSDSGKQLYWFDTITFLR